MKTGYNLLLIFQNIYKTSIFDIMVLSDIFTDNTIFFVKEGITNGKNSHHRSNHLFCGRNH